MSLTSSAIRKGDLSTLIRLSFPFFLFLFCESFAAFCERIFLSYHSTDALPSSLNATYLILIFQGACISIASMAQVFVGFYQGSGELKKIGPCVWQLVWFSFLSMVFTLPLSLWGSSVYFKGTSIEHIGVSYAYILALGNFLFPLNMALTSFYLGRGKTAVVTCCLMVSYAFNTLLGRALILGVEGFIPPLGARGSAIAKCLSLGLFSLVFLALFLRKSHRETYGTACFRFSPRMLWSYMRPGLVRAFAHLWASFNWIVISCWMVKKGGGYLEVQVVGGTISLLCLFSVSGIYRSVLTITSNLLGAKQEAEVWRLCSSIAIYAVMIGAALAVPFLIYPNVFTCLFKEESREMFERTFGMINHWIWFYLIMAILQTGLSAILVAAKDLKAQMYSYFFSILTSIVPVYLAITVWDCEPSTFWLIVFIENAVFAGIFFSRLYHKHRPQKVDESLVLKEI